MSGTARGTTRAAAPACRSSDRRRGGVGNVGFGNGINKLRLGEHGCGQYWAYNTGTGNIGTSDHGTGIVELRDRHTRTTPAPATPGPSRLRDRQPRHGNPAASTLIGNSGTASTLFQWQLQHRHRQHCDYNTAASTPWRHRHRWLQPGRHQHRLDQHRACQHWLANGHLRHRRLMTGDYSNGLLGGWLRGLAGVRCRAHDLPPRSPHAIGGKPAHVAPVPVPAARRDDATVGLGPFTVPPISISSLPIASITGSVDLAATPSADSRF